MKFTLILVIVAILFHDVEIVFAKCSLKYVTRPMAAINYECSGIHLSKLEDELMSILSEDYESDLVILVLERITFPMDSEQVTLSQGWFTAQVSVDDLKLRRMELQYIEEDAFNTKQFEETISLTILNVPIRSLKAGVFNGLPKLQYLTMEMLKLVEIDKNVLAPVHNLVTFTMRVCGPNKIKLDHFFGNVEMMNLIYITVTNCIIEDGITRSTFTGLREVQQLTLQSNQITAIGPHSFDVPLETIDLLDISLNHLTTLPKYIFRTDRQIFKIDVQENPWHCDCNFEYFRVFLQASNNIEMDGMICKTPLEQSGKDLKTAASICDEVKIKIPEMLDILDILENPTEHAENQEIQAEQNIIAIIMKCRVLKKIKRIKLYALPQKRTLSITNENDSLILSMENFSNKKSFFIYEYAAHMDNFRVIKCSNDHKRSSSADLKTIKFEEIRIFNQNSTTNAKFLLRGNIRPILNYSQTYHICTGETGSFSCLAFKNIVNNIEPIPLILSADKLKYMGLLTIVLCISLFFGFGLSFLLARILRKKIIKPQQTSGPITILTLRDIPPPVPIRPNETLPRHRNTLKISDESANQMISVKRRIVTEVSKEVPPPLPPRNQKNTEI